MDENKQNYFTELCAVKCDVEKRKSGGTELSYVSWASAWHAMKEKHPDATYKIYETPDGYPFFSSVYGIDVKVGVTVNGLEHIVRLPVMDGNNNAMKAEAYTYSVRDYKTGQNVDKEVAAADQFDINKAIQRCFAKACAMHGLGLYVYRGEDLPDGSVEKVASKPAYQSAPAPKADPKPDAAYAEYNGTHKCKKCGAENVGPKITNGKFGPMFTCRACNKISDSNPVKPASPATTPSAAKAVMKKAEEAVKLEDIPF